MSNPSEAERPRVHRRRAAAGILLMACVLSTGAALTKDAHDHNGVEQVATSSAHDHNEPQN